MPAKTPLFNNGDKVRKGTTLELGFVSAEPELDAGDYWYKVTFGHRSEQIPEEELIPLEDDVPTIVSLVTENRWGRLDAFRCALALEKLTDPSRNTIYAYNAQRILFQPYQYKPLLKVLDSADRRLLVADEVGLGKTIEAGLVLTELEARQEVDKVLIVCPSRLRDKWREELNRKFNQDFEIFDRSSLRQYIRRFKENPLKSRLRGIVSMNTLRDEELSDEIEQELGSIDMVVVDEAHHARNQGTKTSSMLRMLGRVGECVMLLTATPLHLGNQDLFVLLNALRPSEFNNPKVFHQELERHQPLHTAGRLARIRRADEIPQIAAILKQVFAVSANGALADPLARNLLGSLNSTPPESPQEWIDVERRIQELHPLASILTRTKKRDVQEHAAVRRSTVVKCQWSSDERELYDELVGNGCHQGWFNAPLSIGQIQRARQAASCLPATVETRLMASVTNGDLNTELLDIELPRSAAELSDNQPNRVTNGRFRFEDSKYKCFRDQVIRETLRVEPDAKILVFSFFRGTVKYLEQQLVADGVNCLCIHGDIPSMPLQPDKDERGRRIRQFQEDPDIRVLISTEVGSEGLDFQFCHHLVNYDLPWNPMVVEQRIGRIDRFGQKSDVLHIVNLVVEGTVEDRILLRLYDRIGIFEQSIGDLESILGDEVQSLQKEYLNGQLTPQEADRRVQQAGDAINRQRLQSEELEKRASDLFGHEDYIRSEMTRISRLGRYVGPDIILAVLSNYLSSQHPDASLWESDKGIYTIRLSSRLRDEVAKYSDEKAFWYRRENRDKYQFTMNGELAFSRRDLDLVNAPHPLVKAAVGGISGQMQSAAARVGLASLNRKDIDADLELPCGSYLILLFAINVTGLRNRKLIEAVAWDFGSDALVESEVGELLLHSVCRFGSTLIPVEPVKTDHSSALEGITAEIRLRYRKLKQAEADENEALFLRRSKILAAEERLKEEDLQNRIETVRRKEKGERYVPMFLGQLEKMKAEFRKKQSALETLRSVSVSLSEPIAACLVEIY